MGYIQTSLHPFICLVLARWISFSVWRDAQGWRIEFFTPKHLKPSSLIWALLVLELLDLDILYLTQLLRLQPMIIIYVIPVGSFRWIIVMSGGVTSTWCFSGLSRRVTLATCGPTKDNIHVRSWLPEAVKDRSEEMYENLRARLKQTLLEVSPSTKWWFTDVLKDGTLVVAFEVQGGREDRFSSNRSFGIECTKRCKKMWNASWHKG